MLVLQLLLLHRLILYVEGSKGTSTPIGILLLPSGRLHTEKRTLGQRWTDVEYGFEPPCPQ